MFIIGIKLKLLLYPSAPPKCNCSLEICFHVCCIFYMKNRFAISKYLIMESDAFSDSTSSLDDSYESDENEYGEFFEGCYFKDSFLQLPECFCSEEEVFKEVVGPSTWKTLINSKHAARLKEFLPTFPENDEIEKRNTLRKLFNGENFKFGSPFEHFFHKLKDGFLSSETVEITNALKEASYKEYKNSRRLYSYNLFHDILVSRKRLVDATYSQSPEQAIKMPQFFAKPSDATLSERTRLRYFSALQDLREETGEINTSSDDENYSENCLPKVPKKIKRQLNHEVSNSGLSCITSTTSYPLNFPGCNYFLNHFVEVFEVSEERYREMLLSHKEKMVLDPKSPELAVTHVDLKGINSRCNIPKRPTNKFAENTVKKKIKFENSDKSTNALLRDSGENESSLSFANILIKDESPDPTLEFVPPAVQETEVQTDPLTPIEEEDSQICVNQSNRLASPRSEIQQYPTCFFALLRDIFCESTEHKLSTVKLEEKVRNWQDGPTASLFEWLNFQESWPELVSSALKFLAGDLISILPDTFVPFLDYKEKQQQWQWIGSGRDSDEQMYGLCQQWLENKDDVSLDILETSQGSPPPPRVTTGWTVRPTAESEKQVYRQQECIRYQNPHKAFTFKVHGYEAVVGPVKGVYGKESGINKAREHSLLTSDRPPFVTILSLVRDSAARLPNGEGTRADICELLKDSQYLAAASDQQIHTVVSGALDRLHYEKDPCVKYDVNRKLWIYLHRHRTEEEFERIHQAQAAAAKARKAVQKNKLPKVQKGKEITRTLASIVSSNTDNVTVLNVDIPTTVSSGSSSQSPRSGSSPRTQGSPKSSHPLNRFIIHPVTSSSQIDVKPVVSVIENQLKGTEIVIKKEIDLPSSSNGTVIDVKPVLPVTVSTPIQEFNISRKSSSASIYSFATSKSVIGNLNATQIVSVTPIQIKPCSTDQVKPIASLSSHVHDVLNVDMKPSSPSFVGQPPVLQPVISHPVNEKTNPAGKSTSVSPNLLSAPTVTKTKVNCASLAGLQATSIAGFQTIVIKQEPGLRSCNSVSAIPVLSIEERVPSTNPSAINAGPVVARLVHGSQYLSFSNILASANAGSSNKPISGTVQNFRVHGGNICQQVLSTSTIKVMHSTPVSAITESRFPVIHLKNQSNIKEASVITQSPTSLNVCGRLYQMTNIRNAVISKATETKSTGTTTKESSESAEKETKDNCSISLPTSVYSTPLSLANRNTQPVIKVCPK